MAAVNPMKRSDFTDFIQPKIFTRIFDNPNKTPLAKKLFRNIDVGFEGGRIPILAGKPSVEFVEEAGMKPATTPVYSKVDIQPRKLACIIPMSDELFKLNPAEFENQLLNDVSNAMAEKLDKWLMETIYTATTTAGVTPIEFDPTDPYKVATDIEAGLFNNKKSLNFFAFSKETLPAFDSAKDEQGRPLFNEYGLSKEANFDNYDWYDAEGTIIRYPSIFREGISYTTTDTEPVEVLGFAGDRTKAVGTQLTFYEPKLIPAYNNGERVVLADQENLKIFRFEAIAGLQLGDPASFVPVIAGTTSNKKAEAKKTETK